MYDSEQECINCGVHNLHIAIENIFEEALEQTKTFCLFT